MTCLLLFIPGFIFSQNVKTTTIVLNNKSVEKTSNSRKILSILALGNNKDLNNTELQVVANFQLHPQILTNGKINLEIKPAKTIVGGDIYYRSFKIDSILTLSEYLLQIIVIKDGKEVFNDEIKVPAKGNSVILETVNRIFSLTNTQINIKLNGIRFSKKSYENLNAMVKIVNSYYGFNQVLSDLNSKLKQSAASSNLMASEVLLLWQECQRVDSFINNLGFINKLSLSRNDPAAFNDKYTDFQRHNRRWQTLANQKLKRELKKGFLADKQNYISGLLKISEDSYDRSLELQPYMASSFMMLTEFHRKSDMEIIDKVFFYYDAMSYGDNITVPQQLYDELVLSAEEYYRLSKNTMTLALLKNARRLQEKFSLQQSDLYTNTMAATLNGLIESFLKVSTRAIKSGNLNFAENYYREAEEVYEENKELFEETKIAVTPFLIYINAQKEKAEELYDNKNYQQADEVISNCFLVALEKNLSADSSLLELQKGIRNKIYLQKLNKISLLIDANYISMAENKLFEAEKYFNDNSQIIDANSDFSDLAYAVFIEYLQKGEMLLDRGEIDNAFANLLSAKYIQTNLLNYDVQKLNDLLKEYSEPKILEILEAARLETWAKRSDNADALLDSAVLLQKKYKQENNPVINKSLNELLKKMQSRHCLDAEFNLNENISNFIKNVESANFDKASSLIRSSYLLIEENQDCRLNTHKLDSLLDKYGYVLDFKQKYDHMKSKLFEKGYYDAIEEYLSLRQFYFQYKIDEFNFNLPSLDEFVRQQNLTSLSISSVEYFIDKKQYQLAFEYLKIVQSQGVEAKEIKDIQINLAEAWRNSDDFDKEQVNEMLDDISGEKVWYKYLKREINRKYILFLKN